jgi:hypothetical protein
MVKARSLVGLDVHATKIVAAVLDAETGQLQCFSMSGDTNKAAEFCAALPAPVRVAYEAGPTGYGPRVSWSGAGCSVWSRRRRRSRARRVIGSRPIGVMLSIWPGCWGRASCTQSGFPVARKRRCGTWSGPERPCGWI